jgi:hypothetical protein
MDTTTVSRRQPKPRLAVVRIAFRAMFVLFLVPLAVFLVASIILHPVAERSGRNETSMEVFIGSVVSATLLLRSALAIVVAAVLKWRWCFNGREFVC